jgi:BirA family biotin operon repressor/biotin-[acetyl-CoA-carboxylase] ligase
MKEHFIDLDCVDSTNEWLKRNAQHLNAGELTRVTAKAQSNGRGFRGSTWASPYGLNAYISYYFQISAEFDISPISLLAALCIAYTLKIYGIEGKIKWPNDLLVKGHKIAGVLGEVLQFSGNQRGLILGMGINVNMPSSQLQKIDQPATSLFKETGKQFLVPQFIAKLHLQFFPRLEKFLRFGFQPFIKEINRTLYFTKNFDFQHGNQVIMGSLHSVNTKGQICFVLENGEFQCFSSGRITFSR